MTDWKVPLADVRVSEEEIAAIMETYRSGWLSMGPETSRFEDAFASFVGVPHAFATANGTASLHLLLAGHGIGLGDEVIVPSMTFVATVNAVAYTGATPRFCDIDDLSQPWMSAQRVEPLIGPRTRAILTMSYGGHPGDIEELAQLAASRDVLLLIDAAHAIGSRVAGRSLASFGQGAAFSFFSNKNLAVGEGGMVVTTDEEVAERIRLLRSHGMTTLTWDRHRGHASTYDVVALGYNYRIDEPRATFGRLRLARIDAENRDRARAVERYRAELDTVPGVVPTARDYRDSASSHHLFTVVLDEAINRDGFREFLGRAGVQTSVHYPPVHRFSIYSSLTIDLPLTDAYGAHTVTLPLFSHITEEQVDAVVAGIRQAIPASAISML
jgi:dTDP-4-amino-4,6-dideoxygalactose transaminase